MAKRLLGIILMSVITITAFTGFSVSATEYVSNGGFETVDEDGNPMGWRLVGGSLRESIFVDKASAHNGEKGLGLKPVGTDLYASQSLTLFPGVNYTCTAWLKVVSLEGNHAALKVEFYPEEGSSTIGQDGRTFSIDDANNEWKQVSFTFTVPLGTVSTTFLVRNTSASGEIYWDDISIFETPEEEHPEFLDFGDFEVSGKWAKNGKAIISYDDTDPYDGTYCIQIDTSVAGDSAFAYRSITDGLEIGKSYRLSFWFKTNADTRIKPYIKLLHRYAETDKPNVDLTVNYSNSVAYTGAASGTDSSFKFPDTTKNTWTKYTLYFSIPESGEKTWVQTNVYLGQYGTYVGTNEAATVYYDNVSLTKDYTEVKFYNADTGKEIFTMPETGQNVAVKIHVEAAGKESLIKTISTVSALYQHDGNLRSIKGLGIEEQTNGSLFEVGSFKAMSYLPDIRFTYEVLEGGKCSIDVYFWDSLTNMKPLASKVGISF